MTEHLHPALYALAVWWISTGAILFMTGLPRRRVPWTVGGGTVVLGAALVGVAATAGDVTMIGAYAAFTCGLVAWGWQELSFYTGVVTGPCRRECPAGLSGWQRFRLGVAVTLWHELAIIATAAALVALTWGQPNKLGLYTFLLLWAMRASAKLNVFLGVRNLSEGFLPAHLGYLMSFFRRRRMNALFPVSVTAATALAVLLGEAALKAATGFEAAGFAMLATLTALGVLEHWFMVLPLRIDALWRWSMRAHERARQDAEAGAGDAATAGESESDDVPLEGGRRTAEGARAPQSAARIREAARRRSPSRNDSRLPPRPPATGRPWDVSRKGSPR